MLRISSAAGKGLILALAAAFAFSNEAIAQNQLTAVKAAQPPKLEALAADPAWANAPELKVKLNNGAHFDNGSTTVALKAAYTADRIYVLVRYADPTQSSRREPFVKQADGKWMKLHDPDDKGGDNTKYYEDKFALLWNINNSIRDFDRKGWFALCHDGEAGKPFGNKYTASEGEFGGKHTSFYDLFRVEKGKIARGDVDPAARRRRSRGRPGVVCGRSAGQRPHVREPQRRAGAHAEPDGAWRLRAVPERECADQLSESGLGPAHGADSTCSVDARAGTSRRAADLAAAGMRHVSASPVVGALRS